MSTGTGKASLADPGLSALVLLLLFHGLGAIPSRSVTVITQWTFENVGCCGRLLVDE
jgi:hypothetical protein